MGRFFPARAELITTTCSARVLLILGWAVNQNGLSIVIAKCHLVLGVAGIISWGLIDEPQVKGFSQPRQLSIEVAANLGEAPIKNHNAILCLPDGLYP